MICTKKIAYVTLGVVVCAAVVVAIVLAVVLTGNDDTTNPEVTISQGTLRGVNLETQKGQKIYAFKSIPYAEPPVGELRFKAPVAPSAWDGTLDASSDSNLCSQPATDGLYTGDEDCLYLHVYTPWTINGCAALPNLGDSVCKLYAKANRKIDDIIYEGNLTIQLPTSEDTTLLPVMVFAYGGGFREGGNWPEEYGPEYLLDQDVVLIVPNYRLGILGFLSTGDEASPGNYGLKDMVRALEWSRDNIKYFGGDYNQTTVFGQSAGGMIAHLLALSPLTEGLMQRSLAQSGTALSYDGHRPVEVLRERAFTVGEHFNCSTETTTALVDCLRGFTPAELMATSSLFTVWRNYPNVIWSPTTEPDIEGAFLTERPVDILTNGTHRDLPFLATANREEGINHAERFIEDMQTFEDFLDNMTVALAPWLTYDSKVANVTAYTEALVSYYFNDLTADRDVLLYNFTILMGDALCGYPSYRANQLHLPHGEQPNYLGSFEYRGALTYVYSSTFGAIDNTSVAHGDEMIYQFPLERAVLGPEGSERTENDWKMVDTIVQLWTSYATTGTPVTTVSGEAVTWQPYSTRKNYLRIGNHSDLSVADADDFLSARMQFWDELTAATTWL